jgi:imidazolonepropionase-like amidohydrolase
MVKPKRHNTASQYPPLRGSIPFIYLHYFYLKKMFMIIRLQFLILLLVVYSFSRSQTKYVIKNVSVIPMTKEIVLKNKTVTIEGNKILSIENSGAAIPKGATVIDGTSKYLMPGLFDMHVHFFNEQGELKNTTEKELKVMLANGLTTARVMAGHPNYLEAKVNVKVGKWAGPDLVVASPQLAGRWPWPTDFKNFELVDTKEKAIAAVKKFKAEGYDAIKITFMVSKPVFDAVAETAKTEGIQLIGHVGPRVKLPAALAIKQQNEHMDEFIDMLLPDTSYNHGESVSDMNLWRMNAWATVPYLDEKKIPALVKMVKESGIYVTPTNFFFVSCFGTAYTDEVYKNRPDYKYIPSAILPEKWKIKEMNRNMKIPEASLKKYVYLRKKMVYELWKGGVPLMTGSDSPEWFLVPGFATHDEIGMFVEAGLTPFAALQTATVNPAKYLGLNKGTVEKGKIADLVLLDKNPLENISNTKLINGVMKNGIWYNKQTIDKMLEEALALGIN